MKTHKRSVEPRRRFDGFDFTVIALAVAIFASFGDTVLGQNLKTAAQIANTTKTQKESTPLSKVSSTSNGSVDDPCKKHADELAKLRLEAAGKVKETERIRLLDSDLGAMQQTALADIHTRIKNVELALARCEEKERERKEMEKLKMVQEHELKLEGKRHENQKELMAIQQEAARLASQPLAPAEKDFFEIFADQYEATVNIQQGFKQLKSTDTSVQVQGLRQIGTGLKQASPPQK